MGAYLVLRLVAQHTLGKRTFIVLQRLKGNKCQSLEGVTLINLIKRNNWGSYRFLSPRKLFDIVLPIYLDDQIYHVQTWLSGQTPSASIERSSLPLIPPSRVWFISRPSRPRMDSPCIYLMPLDLSQESRPTPYSTHLVILALLVGQSRRRAMGDGRWHWRYSLFGPSS